MSEAERWLLKRHHTWQAHETMKHACPDLCSKGETSLLLASLICGRKSRWCPTCQLKAAGFPHHPWGTCTARCTQHMLSALGLPKRPIPALDRVWQVSPTFPPSEQHRDSSRDWVVQVWSMKAEAWVTWSLKLKLEVEACWKEDDVLKLTPRKTTRSLTLKVVRKKKLWCT